MKQFKCSTCERVYDFNRRAVKKDRVSGEEYMRCPSDGTIAFELVVKEKPKAKPAPRKRVAKKEEEEKLDVEA